MVSGDSIREADLIVTQLIPVFVLVVNTGLQSLRCVQEHGLFERNEDAVF